MSTPRSLLRQSVKVVRAIILSTEKQCECWNISWTGVIRSVRSSLGRISIRMASLQSTTTITAVHDTNYCINCEQRKLRFFQTVLIASECIWGPFERFHLSSWLFSEVDLAARAHLVYISRTAPSISEIFTRPIFKQNLFMWSEHSCLRRYFTR